MAENRGGDLQELGRLGLADVGGVILKKLGERELVERLAGNGGPGQPGGGGGEGEARAVATPASEGGFSTGLIASGVIIKHRFDAACLTVGVERCAAVLRVEVDVGREGVVFAEGEDPALAGGRLAVAAPVLIGVEVDDLHT